MTDQVMSAGPADQADRDACRHHWVIDAPEGPFSRGSCSLCGETRQFKNYIESAPWGEERTLPHTLRNGPTAPTPREEPDE